MLSQKYARVLWHVPCISSNSHRRAIRALRWALWLGSFGGLTGAVAEGPRAVPDRPPYYSPSPYYGAWPGWRAWSPGSPRAAPIQNPLSAGAATPEPAPAEASFQKPNPVVDTAPAAALAPPPPPRAEDSRAGETEGAKPPATAAAAPASVSPPASPPPAVAKSSGEPAIRPPDPQTPALPAAFRLTPTRLGLVLADTAGRTLYTAGTEWFRCSGRCAALWSPLFATPGSPAPEAPFGLRATGEGRQWTVRGRGLYRFRGDRLPGDVTGDGIGGLWQAVRLGADSER